MDKLDKLPWADVRKEMVDEKGLAGDVADKIGEYVKLKGQLHLFLSTRLIILNFVLPLPNPHDDSSVNF